MAGGNPSNSWRLPVLTSEAFHWAKAQMLQGEVTSCCSHPSYLQQMMNPLMMLSPGNRMAARQQTDRQRGPCALLVATQISRVGWGREYGKELVKIPKTNSWFLPFLPWAHPHTDAMLILTAKEWEWRKGLGLAGWKEGRFTYVGEMVGPAEDSRRTGTRWGGEIGRKKNDK